MLRNDPFSIVTGFALDLGIIDAYVKNRAKANS